MPYEPINGRGFAHGTIAGVPARLKELMKGDTVTLAGGQCQQGGEEYFTVNQNNLAGIQVCDHYLFVQLIFFLVKLICSFLFKTPRTLFASSVCCLTHLQRCYLHCVARFLPGVF